jgi:hypothetical protein
MCNTHTTSKEKGSPLQNMEKQGEVTALDKELLFYGSVSV